MLKSLLAIVLLVITPLTLAETLYGNVVGITDGDTLTLLVDRTQIKVRLTEIDTPERDRIGVHVQDKPWLTRCSERT